MIANSPVNAGHSYANAAEDYEDREEWAQAAEAHGQAAEQFQKAVEFTQDPVTCKTLQLLHLDHLRKAKELERKIAKQREQEQPQRPIQTSQRLGQSNSFDMNGLRHALPRRLARSTHGAASPAIGGSYAVLPPDGQEEEEDGDDSDPFNKFWEVVETLVDKLSNPVAFASAPLNENDNPTPAWNASSDDEEDDGVAAAMVESYFFVPEPRQGPGQHDYAAENEQLKKQIEQLVRRVQTLEKTAEESNMLKSSILQFRNDVQKQAKRIMQNHDYSHMRASSSAALIGSNAHYSSIMRPSGDINLAARVKELEEENRQLRVQSEKQQALMNKYRERWEKLKESAKKRRAQQPEQDSRYTKLASCSSEYAGGRQPTLLRSLAQQSTPPFADPSRQAKGSPGN
ncbi:hypothetical protein BJV82DRAFT_614239 [Fennellomyces sp. T-0311]|nr:hypothetical protein BJV82DRAFT_614239 [Fennellomyces sp. T-0311]